MIIAFQLVVVFAGALECNKDLCPDGNALNGSCDVNCMNSPCYFDTQYAGYDSKFQIRLSQCLWKCLEVCTIELLMNDVCDPQCNIQECGYDRSVCGYCADGCYEHMLGNRICDQKCNNDQCRLDFYDCGDCADGCFSSMLGNGKCDKSCYNTNCRWDYQDCNDLMCSPGCNPDMIGNLVCNEECNVERCEYDGGDCYCDPKKLCNPQLRESLECHQECNVKECGWHDGKCGDCNSGCFYVMIGDGHCDQSCNVEECKFDFLDCISTSSVDFSKVYVTNEAKSEEGSGTREDPYTKLYYALAKARSANTIIYMLSGEHSLKLESGYTSYDPLKPTSGNLFTRFYLTTAFCSDDDTLPGCAYERATIYLDDKITISATADNFMIGNIHFRGDNLVCKNDPCNDCTLLTCKYCPYTKRLLNGKYLSDKLEIISSSDYKKYATKCTDFYYYYRLIRAKLNQNLTIINVKFSNFLTKQRTIITSEDTNLTLINVDFERIIIDGLFPGMVIYFMNTRDSPDSVSHFIYTGGSVKYLNNGYELQELPQGGFLNGESYYISVEISNVEFSYNLVQYPSINSEHNTFITLDSRNSYYTIKNCIFQNNYTDTNLIFIRQRLSPSSDQRNPDFVNGFKLINVTFIKNTSRYGIIRHFDYSSIANIYFSSVKFDRCVSSEMAMITVEHSISKLDQLTYGEYMDLNKNLYNLGFQNLTFTECYSGVNFINITNILYTVFDGLILENSADDNESIDDLVNEFTLNDFKNLEVMGLQKGNIYQYKMNSIGFIAMNYINTVYIANSLFKGNKWKTNSLLNIKNADSVEILDTKFQDNMISSDEGGVINLSMINTEGILINKCIFYNITDFSGASVINISSSTTARIAESSFENIMMNSNSAVRISRLEQVQIDSCSFKSLDSQYGKSAGISFEGCNEVRIDNSTFTQINNPSEASAIYIKSSINATIINSKFSESQGGNFGTILTDEIESLDIKGCTFSSVISSQHGGAIYMHFMKLVGSGNSLAIRDSKFSECLSEKGFGCVYITSAEENLSVKINLVSLEFKDCQANMGSAIYINNLVKIDQSNIQYITITSNYNTLAGPIHTIHLAGTLNLRDCIFYKNKGNVAAISALFPENGDLLSLCNVQVIDNECNISGIYLQSLSYSTKVTTKSLDISNNSCPGVHFNNLLVVDSDTKIDGNLIGIRLENKAKLEMSNARILNNKNTEKGGGVYVQSYSNFSCKECIISGNTAYIGGGVMLDQEASAILTGTRISNNHAEKSGSAIYLIECLSTNTYLDDCDILNNTSNYDGSILGIVSSISIKNSRIESNESDVSSPGIVLNYSTLYLYNTAMQNQTSITGAFIYAQTLSIVNIEECEFSNGKASKNAGAVAILGSSAYIINSVFKNLSSYGNSAAILASEKSDISIRNSIFSDLRSASEGSAIYSYDSSVDVYDSNFKNFMMTGIFGVNLGHLKVSDSSFKEGFGQNGGAIACIQCKNIEISGSNFSNNHALDSGGALYFQLTSKLEDNRYRIGSCRFEDNLASRGGGLYSDGGNMIITNSSFFNNKALLEGGGAYFEFKSNDTCQFEIESTRAARNVAGTAGGGIYWDDRKPILHDNNIFFSNTAKYGKDIASYPIKIQYLLNGQILEYPKNVTLNNQLAFTLNNLDPDIPSAFTLNNVDPDIPLAFTLYNVAPGQSLKEKIQIALVDHYKMIVTSDSVSYAEIFPKDAHTSSILGTTKVVADKGIYNFDNLIILTKPGSSTYLLITSSAINTTKRKKAGDKENYYPSVFIQVSTRECLVGESDLGNECKNCGEGTYSIDPEELCQECPVEAECLGGYKMYPKKHYWRSDMYTDIFLECLNYDACLGSPDYDSYTGECEEGYRGNLCQACDNGYSRRSKNVCAKCLSENMNRLITSLVSIAIVVYCTIAVRISIISSYKSKSLQAMYIKIFINYWQLIGIIMGLEIPWPESLINFFSNNINSSSYSYDCLLETSDSDSYIQVYYKKIVINALLPLFAILICVIVWSIISFRKNNSKYLKVELVATIVILLLFLHPTTTEVLLSIYSCRELEGEGFYLNANLDIECWKGDHLFYAVVVALPSVMIWALGVPLGILMYLSRRKKHLKDIDMKLRFGFLYNGYKLRNYYWQFLVLFRNVLLIMIIVFLSRFDVDVQALACLLMLILSYCFHVTVYPYKHKKLNDIDQLGILMVTLTIYFGLYFMTDDINEESKILLCVVILVANCYFILTWLSQFGYSLFINLANRIFFLRSRFDKHDGFTHEYYLEHHLNRNIYIVEDQAIFTLISIKPPERENLVVSIPENMVDLYKFKLINDSIEGVIDSKSSDETYDKDSILSSSISLYTSERETFLDSSFIKDYKIN